MNRLRDELLRELSKRKWDGLLQNEIYPLLSYSRSHVSETLHELEKESLIIRKIEGRSSRRIWLKAFFPGRVERLIRLGVLQSSEYVPFICSMRRTVEESGYELAISVFKSPTELITALHHYVIEIGLAPTLTHILFSLTDPKEKIVCSLASGGSSVLINRKTSSELLAASESSTMALISRDLLKLKNVRIRFYDNVDKSVADFLSGDLKYLAIWEPYLSDLASRDEISSLVSDGTKGFLEPCCTVGANLEMVESDPDLLRKISADYSKFLRNLENESLEYGLRVIAEATGYSMNNVRRSLSSYTFSSRSDADILGEYMIEVGIPVSSERLRDIILT